MGGQGGGVLANWVRDLAESNGYFAQSTSVPGVAQRTGATVYYIEIFPEQAVEDAGGKQPVLSLSAVAGDVDIVIAAEWMEAGRAVQRGFVTPDRTTLIASTHRAYAVSEKIVLGDGIANSEAVLQATKESARRLICADFQTLAEQHGAVISASMFGALGGAGVLPFNRQAFEDTITKSGIALSTNMAAFAAGWTRAEAESTAEDTLPISLQGKVAALPEHAASKTGQMLLDRIRAELPSAVQATAFEGCRQLVDFQDGEYAALYLDRLALLLKSDSAEKAHLLTHEMAKYLCNWMNYQDTIRVADQKTRADRYQKILSEVKAEDGQLVYPIEYMHPRFEEICDTLPAPLARRLLGSTRWQEFMGRFFKSGRRIQTYKLGGFLLLYLLAGMRRIRRSTYRYQLEQQRIEVWMQRIVDIAERDYEQAVEICRCQRLLKGYSDTQERSWSNFASLMQVVDDDTQQSDAELVKALRQAALADDEGKALRQALQRLSDPQARQGIPQVVLQ